MNRSGSLYRLVRAMSQSEKRYFTLQAAANRDSSDYLRMFRALDEQKITDDDSFKKELNRETEIRHFAVKKIQLYHLLLKSLRNFHEGRSFDFTLKEMMLDASILSDKALYHDCYSVLNRAKKIAKHYEEWKVQLEILHKEYTIIQYIVDAGQLEKEIIRFNADEKKIIRELNNYGDISYLAMKLRMLMRRSEDQKQLKEKALQQLMSNAVLQSEKKAVSVRSKSLYFVIRSAYFLHKLQYEKAEEMLKKHIALYEQHPQFIAASPGNYLTALNELLLVHFRLHRYEKAAAIIEHLRKLSATSNIRKLRSSRFKMVLLSWTFPIELAISIQTGTTKQTSQSLAEAEEYFVRHASLFESQKRVEIFLTLAAYYFELNDFKKAISFIQKILRNSDSSREQQAFYLTHILQALIHFEEGNSDLLNYLVLALKRMTVRSKSKFMTEKLLSEMTAKLVHPPADRKRAREFYSSYLKKFEQLKNDRREQPLFDHFDITRWLEKKLK